METRPRQSLAYLVVAAVALFAAGHLWFLHHSVEGLDLGPGVWTILGVKAAVEVVAGAYGIAFLLSSIAFLRMRDSESSAATAAAHAPDTRVGIVYLCCDDADWSALKSLAALSYRGPLCLVIHDDSKAGHARNAVDCMAARLRTMRSWEVLVLRRPDRSGGKAGAVNYALAETAHRYDYFLLCDNDSTVLQPETIECALAACGSAQIGAVQFRSVPVEDPSYCGANRLLAESIGAFHAFLAPASRFGWMPFIGHNALLRTAAVQQVGGLTPGFFSDDLDLTVRLNLAGHRIVYAPHITMGEKHPPSYTAFRKRSYKWAYGCIQTLRAHWRSVLTSRQFSLAEKLSFFQFVGFYCLQCLLLLYMTFALLVVPSGILGSSMPGLATSVTVGVILIGLVYAPLLSFYLKRRSNRKPEWVRTLALCGLVYGGTDFSVFRGVTDALLRRRRPWVPTNGVAATAVDPALFLEAAFGLSLLTVPLLYMPELLYLPSWFLFAGKFLFGPALSLAYRDETHDAFAEVLDPEPVLDRRPGADRAPVLVRLDQPDTV